MREALANLLLARESGGTVEIVHRLTCRSWLPGWMLPFLVAAVIGLSVWQYRRQGGVSPSARLLLVALRAAAGLAALLLVARPELEIQAEGVRPGPVPVVVDGTQSMAIRDVGGRSRLDAARQLATALLDRQSQYPDLRLTGYWAGATFGRFEAGRELVPDAEITALNRMLENGQRAHVGSYCPGFVLITDGAHNAPEPIDTVLARLARERVPLYILGTGEQSPRDVALPFLLAEDVVFRGEKAKVYVNLTHRGYPGRDLTVVLSLNGEKVASEVVQAGETAEMSVPVEYQPTDTGEFDLQAEVQALPDEITADNNVYVKRVRVIDEKIRVLLVVGAPTWEYRYLRGSLDRDQRVRAVTYLESLDRRLARRNLPEYVLRLPDSPAALQDEYDLVVLSAVNAVGLPPAFLQAVAGFVTEHAGGLVLIADPQWVPYSLKDTVLEPLVPVTVGGGLGLSYREELQSARTGPLRFTITDEGLSSPLLAFSGSREENREFWKSMPPLYDCYRDGRLKPAAVSLLVALEDRGRQSYPAIVHQACGKGTVLFMGFDSTWRWRREYGDRYYREFWGKAVQFLGLPHLLHEAAQAMLHVSRDTWYVGERVSVTAKLSNADYSPYLAEKVPVTVRQGDAVLTVDLVPIPDRQGMYRANLWPERAGEMTLELPEPFRTKPLRLRVLHQSREFTESGMNRALLEHAAEVTGGRFYVGAETRAEDVLRDIQARRARVELAFRRSLWDTWAMLLLCLGLFSAEWLVRKLAYLD